MAEIKNLGRVVGKSAYEIAVINGFQGTEQEWLNSIKGDRGNAGKDGTNGKDGVSPAVSITQTSEGATITVTDASGTSSAKVYNGAKGDRGERGLPGDKGDPGVPGVPGKNGTDGTNGTNGKDGKTPVRGVDYWTASDKQTIVNDTLAALPTWNWEAV